MEPNPHYRYLRSLGHGASLWSVTEPGIDEFLAAPDAGLPGLVVLAVDGAPDAPPDVRFLGGPRVGEVLRRLHAGAGADLAVARPLAVVSVEAAPGARWIGTALVERLRALAEAAAEDGARAAPGGLGSWEGLLSDLPGAVAHVIGYDPFEPRPQLN